MGVHEFGWLSCHRHRIEKVIEEAGQPYTIVRFTQFFEFLRSIADAGTAGDTVLVSTSCGRWDDRAPIDGSAQADLDNLEHRGRIVPPTHLIGPTVWDPGHLNLCGSSGVKGW